MVTGNPIGERIKALRVERKMNQVDVAVAVGKSRSHIAGIETGKDKPGRETLVALAELFGVSLDWLASSSGPLRPGEATAQTEDEALLLYAWRALPPDEAKGLLKMLLGRVGKGGSGAS